LREKRRLRVFENRVLRGVFGCRRDEEAGERNKLHNELNDLHSSPKGHAVAQWLRHCATNRKFAGSIPDGVIVIFR
jgi:hypothetical protein